MAAPPEKPTQGPKPAIPAPVASTASVRLEKSHPGVRRSTPDSEALASSDDDVEHSHLPQTSATFPAAKPARRTSWLNEIPVNMPRKASLTTTGALLPGSGASNPTSPAADQSGWPSGASPGLSASMSWNHVGNSSFPWGTGIWNTESRKEPPPRLSEIVPSPTMTAPTANSYFAEELMSPTTRTTSGDSAIPFSIPLHPTPKTYRSQSYSVGQLDPEYLATMANKAAAPHPSGRARNAGQYSALQHRSSRPSLLGELGHDPATLGRVREDDDDGGSANSSDGSLNAYSVNQARTIEQLARENALLRQAAGQQIDNRLRDRAMSSASTASGYAIGSNLRNLHRIHGTVPEETDLAVEDLDELGDIPGYTKIHSNQRRRFSEHSANLEKQLSNIGSLENRALDNARKAHWQTTLGFGSLADIPQSRRHSFADIPIRHGSISGDPQAAAGARAGMGDREDHYASVGDVPLPSAQSQNREYHRLHMAPRPEEHEMEMEYLRARQFAESYFARDHALRAADGPSATSLQQPYSMPGNYGRHQPGLAHNHVNQTLYIVTFKCHRADVFYIQEDTGLQVKPGDLVIVEADRGTDLGTIQHANVSLQRARELKQQYAEEHYKWLMMFSRQGQNGPANVSASGPALSGRSAIGGMGPHGPHGVQDLAGDIKPKLIKRLAQNHEILTLRDKEGNEAKAKRVCQQKVAEHRLNMEILDAEFQMDWKKLTFYYFADSYINFNCLVTDLFKIYKTRIWMSAINPASFVTPPTAGLPAPGGAGTAESRAYGAGREGMDVSRDTMGSQARLLRGNYNDSNQSLGQGPRQLESNVGELAPNADPFSPYQPNTYGGAMETGYVDYAAHSPGAGGGPSRMHQAPNDWAARFQGLSLGS
ncbi:PSP1 domain protein [Aspergillus clavatus NRRL 1]|uniref:PSP1 domain protein n=1 Tax=Aspergillus clavatus (strain ATCC 1007 / CBS 513.65 / DSM 816 / NCTC 3887 / NRRL 1 / QM 1276 / 107) TaxID=344612 RepID=A1CRJ7_ASPCL|nr:PSP1 domain protein [Aspergillus clavatus NRRL 1]EAW08268.1 PSP1 domain protein [Aspergillus clavatus NRRL 1]